MKEKAQEAKEGIEDLYDLSKQKASSKAEQANRKIEDLAQDGK